MCVTICGRFCSDEGAVAGYGNRIRVKYTAILSCSITENSDSVSIQLICIFLEFLSTLLL
ncbi:MAG: DUF6783 domain-containing protein [Blautia faecis]